MRRGAPLLLLLALACAGPPAQGPAPEPATGRERLVTLAPNLTELAFALGLGDRVVGVDDFSAWPPEVASRPRLGGLLDPNLEGILALEPDLALVLPSQSRVGEQLGRLGVDVLTLPADTLDDVEGAILAVAGRCGVPQAGRELLARWRAALAPRPVPGRPRVVLSLGRQPGRLAEILVAGPGTFLTELLDRLGAENVFADAPLAYPQVSLEELLARAPEVIVELHSQELDAGAAQELKNDWRRLPEIPAVAAGRIEVVAGAYTLIPGPRLPRLYERLAAALGGEEKGAAR